MYIGVVYNFAVPIPPSTDNKLSLVVNQEKAVAEGMEIYKRFLVPKKEEEKEVVTFSEEAQRIHAKRKDKYGLYIDGEG